MCFLCSPILFIPFYISLLFLLFEIQLQIIPTAFYVMIWAMYVHGQWREISALFDQLFSILIGKIIKSHSFHFLFFRQRRKQKFIFHFISFASFELGLQQKQYEIVKRKHEWRERILCGLKENTKTFFSFLFFFMGLYWVLSNIT